MTHSQRKSLVSLLKELEVLPEDKEVIELNFNKISSTVYAKMRFFVRECVSINKRKKRLTVPEAKTKEVNKVQLKRDQLEAKLQKKLYDSESESESDHHNGIQKMNTT